MSKKMKKILMALSCMFGLANAQNTLNISASTLELVSPVDGTIWKMTGINTMDAFQSTSYFNFNNGAQSRTVYYSGIAFVSVNGGGSSAPASFNALRDTIKNYIVTGASSGGSGGTASSVVVTSSALPSGASTASAQTSAQTSLTSIDSKATYLVPSTAVFGTTAPTITTYSTNSNTVTTTSAIHIIVENFSTTTNATITYAGRAITLGYKGNPSGYNTTYMFSSIFDQSIKKYTPFATMTIDASGADVSLTKTFTQ